MATRRQILKGTLLGGLVVVSGVSIWQWNLEESQTVVEQDKYPYQYLTEDDRLVLFALMPAFLGKALDNLDSKEFRINLLQQLDQAIDFISQSSYDELRQLLDLLANQLGRAYVAGVWSSWSRAKPNELADFLNDWRTSFITLLRSGYLGLHQLIFGAFYAQAKSWPAIDYPGPPKMKLEDSFYQQFDLQP